MPTPQTYIYLQGIFKNGLVIKNRGQIFKRQYKNIMQIIYRLNFEIKNIYIFKRKDILIIVFIILSINFEQNSPLSYLNYLVFFKLNDVSSKLEELELKLQLNDTMSNLFKLFKLQFFIFFIAHIICCIFLKIGLENQHTGQSWIIFYNLSSAGFQEQYLNSLYYCLITMTTIGYGDITPKSLSNLCQINFFLNSFFKKGEKSFILGVSVVTCAIFGYTFSQISEIVKDLEKKKKDFNRNMQIINREMNNKGISITLQHKVRKYFEYQKKIEEKKSFMQTDMIEILPQILKQEVLLDVNKQILEKHYIFSKLSIECMQEISLIFHQKKYFPGEVIFKEGEREQNLYFIWSGEVNITKQYQSDDSTSQETTLRILKKKDFFGQVGFFIDNPNPYSAKSNTFLNLSFITRSEFFACLQKFPKDYISFLEIKCFSCGDYNHYLQQCPSVHLVTSFNQRKQKPDIISQENISTRRKIKKVNALYQLERYYNEIIDFWNQKFNDGEEDSILNDIIENKRNNSFEINTIKQVSEHSVEHHDDKQSHENQRKQKHAFSILSSKGRKRLNSQHNYPSSHFVSSNKNINNQNNFSNQINIREENLETASEQSIQNIKQLYLKQNENLQFENNSDSPVDIYYTKFNIGVFKASSINIKKSSCKSDLSVLPDQEDNFFPNQYHNTIETPSKKQDKSLSTIQYAQNIVYENHFNFQQISKDYDQSNSKQDEIESFKQRNCEKIDRCHDEDITLKQSVSFSNILDELKAQKAQFIELRQDESPFKISNLQEEPLSTHFINSPLRKNVLKKSFLKKQPSIELEVYSAEQKNREGQKKFTEKKSMLSKQILMVDNNQNMLQSNNLSQIIQLNTQNLINYIKLMQDNKLINPIIENKMASQAELIKKRKVMINRNGTLTNQSDNEVISLTMKDEKVQSSRNFTNNKKQQSLTGSINKKAEKQIMSKLKTTISAEKNQFFPINEEIFRRNTCDMDVNLLIFRKKLLWNFDIQKQIQGVFEIWQEDDFDIYRSYKIYFPQGNLENVVTQYNNKQVQILKKQNPIRNSKLKTGQNKSKENRLSKIVVPQSTFAARQTILKKI